MSTASLTLDEHVNIFGIDTDAPAPAITREHARSHLGGKGATLAEMARLGLPIPPGITLSTEICNVFLRDGEFPAALKPHIETALAKIGTYLGKQFDTSTGISTTPLLVSVRSGARISMPGMMDTVLNLGLNDESVLALASATDNRRFAWDSYRRFIQIYSDVVLGVSHDLFEDILSDYRLDHALDEDSDFVADDWQAICIQFKDCVLRERGEAFPQDPHVQLWAAIAAVFQSWNTARAQTYRRLHNIPDEWGTAVTVQAMVFGNLGETSATGVAFTRNPSTGAREIYGEYLLNAQGEDVVAGIRTPHYISRAARAAADDLAPALEETLPQNYETLTETLAQLEAHFGDMQDVEFTIEDGVLWILQSRNGKRSINAALQIVVDMVEAGLLDKPTALMRLDPLALDQLLHPRLDPDAPRDVLTKGLPASPGAASGIIMFSADAAEAAAARGERVILVRSETSPEDIHGMYAAAAVLTSRGGMTSHAAVVARGLGRPCVSGAGAVRIDLTNRTAQIGGSVFAEGDALTIDGSHGVVMGGLVPMVEPIFSDAFRVIMRWADAHKRLAIRANAETQADIRTSLRFGAEGIGLVRTEHMFFDPARIIHMREMILARDDTARDAALAKLEPMQRQDFCAILEAMGERPVTIRLLDPPLHEFLPHVTKDIVKLAEQLGMEAGALAAQIERLRETNPMLGHRGCRLGISYPSVYAMQARALFGAMAETKTTAQIEIMIPLIVSANELVHLKTLIDETAAAWADAHQFTPVYQIGAMIETPRAALCADTLAPHARFFSFGTNDLTQTSFGMSRDDANIFLPHYIEAGILPRDPFAELDARGVGQLMEIAVAHIRAQDSAIKIGICGEHGGNPPSIILCEKLGLDYVSCSPFRIPIARLAAAQAHIKANKSSDDIKP